ncbi:MAG: hypothetical protein JWO60_2744, partial [Frankiales bacterium]|nr:hypothetical protein [Frankiales bacterium]
SGRPAIAGPSTGASPAPSPSPTAAPGHTVFAAGPDSPAPTREATFQLLDGGPWECQLQGNGDGSASSWRPCSGTFTRTVRRDGEHVLRVRDAASHDLVDTWAWTVVPSAAG